MGRTSRRPRIIGYTPAASAPSPAAKSQPPKAAGLLRYPDRGALREGVVGPAATAFIRVTDVDTVPGIRTMRLPVSQTAKTAYSVETIPNAKVKNPYGTNARLARHEPCVLCGSASRMFANGENKAVDCEGCGRYLMSGSASDMVDERRAEGIWAKADSGFVSGFIRYHRAAGQDADWVLVTIRTFDHLRVPRAAATTPPPAGRPAARGTSLSN